MSCKRNALLLQKLMMDTSVNAFEVAPPYLGRRGGRAPALGLGVKGGGAATAAAWAGVSSRTRLLLAPQQQLLRQLHKAQVGIESLSHQRRPLSDLLAWLYWNHFRISIVYFVLTVQQRAASC
ncbi:Hypothetical predicted protein [Xyrichtys novacula]|uniref:Uncharacterized protein n=1 Tax=Xyrichtys novacula TaxID=13765 RepID=A0AAV1FBW3_XYRNO|nr:Hypothetical predicted protein [Xyrichtys novacula]